MFTFELKDAVVVRSSGEQGVVEGRCQYLHHQNSYYVNYVTTDGRATKDWWGESDLDKSGP